MRLHSEAVAEAFSRWAWRSRHRVSDCRVGWGQTGGPSGDSLSPGRPGSQASPTRWLWRVLPREQAPPSWPRGRAEPVVLMSKPQLWTPLGSAPVRLPYSPLAPTAAPTASPCGVLLWIAPTLPPPTEDSPAQRGGGRTRRTSRRPSRGAALPLLEGLCHSAGCSARRTRVLGDRPEERSVWRPPGTQRRGRLLCRGAWGV